MKVSTIWSTPCDGYDVTLGISGEIPIGPPLVKAATQEVVTAEELGGAPSSSFKKVKGLDEPHEGNDVEGWEI
jgi:hypothetical protein